MSELLLLLVLLFLLWLWRDNLQARESAIKISRRACEQVQAQLLDDTVALVRLRLCRTKKGTMALCRVYEFEFSLDGEKRRTGTITMKAQVVENLVLDIDNTTILQ
jgi:hypothetical protein